MPEHVVDAHVHLWNLSNAWYPGLKAMADGLDRPDLYADFGLDDYARAAGPLTVDRFVHVSAVTAPHTYTDELRWISTAAEATGADMRFIGTVDPTLPAAELIADLDAQLAITPHFRGARVLYDFEPDSLAATHVLRWLDEHDLVFDLVTHPETMDPWIRALEPYPDLAVVLEHTGWPTGTDDSARAAWLRAIASCAASTTASCKVSGLGMVTLDLSPDSLRPWIEPAIETFGWDRVIFGSNVPIEHMAGAYQTLLTSLDSILADADAASTDRFYRRNAVDVYGFGEQ